MSFSFGTLSITLIHTPQKFFFTKRCGTLSEPNPPSSATAASGGAAVAATSRVHILYTPVSVWQCHCRCAYPVRHVVQPRCGTCSRIHLYRSSYRSHGNTRSFGLGICEVANILVAASPGCLSDGLLTGGGATSCDRGADVTCSGHRGVSLTEWHWIRKPQH